MIINQRDYENLIFFKWYIKHESTAGITLLVMTIIALIISNSFLSDDYFKALKRITPLVLVNLNLNYLISLDK